MTTTNAAQIMTFSGLHPFRVLVEEIGRTTTGHGSITYKVTAVKSGSNEGYIRRSLSYNNHSDYGRRTLDGKGDWLGDNLTLRQAVDRVLCI